MVSWGLAYAQAMHLISENVAKSELINKIPSEKTVVEALTIEQQQKFLEAINENNNNLKPYSDMWLLALATGMRIGEICAVNITDIDKETKTILINKTITRANGQYILGNTTKTKTSRKIQFGSTVAKIINDVMQYRIPQSKYLFTNSQDGQFIKPNQSTNELHNLNKYYHIAPKLTTHMLRHTYITRMIEQGFPPQAVQKIVGHSSIKTTLDVYTSFFAEQEEKYTNQIDDYWKEVIK